MIWQLIIFLMALVVLMVPSFTSLIVKRSVYLSFHSSLCFYNLSPIQNFGLGFSQTESDFQVYPNVLTSRTCPSRFHTFSDSYPLQEPTSSPLFPYWQCPHAEDPFCLSELVVSMPTPQETTAPLSLNRTSVFSLKASVIWASTKAR
jgi:hypothetical protein